mmetsp:Transcript_10518/g.15379  ORF Transcript_10518/g.15379 Transcript_10518/m.15379 type:complete len:266 (+) Transcript_10518:40-837(+)
MKLIIVIIACMLYMTMSVYAEIEGGRCQDYGIRKYDYFVVAMTWGKTFCATKKNCIRSKIQNRFTIHGLWPNLATPINGKYWPQCCNNSDIIDPNRLRSQLSDELNSLWPDVLISNAYSTNGLYAHEWSKHGTCANMTQIQYFEKALHLASGFDMLGGLARNGIKPDDSSMQSASRFMSAIKSTIGGAPQLSITFKNNRAYLGEVWVCVDKTFRPMDCPKAGSRASEFIFPASIPNFSRRSMDEEEPLTLRPTLVNQIKAIVQEN